ADGLGGADHVRAVKSVRQKMSLRVKGPQGEMTLDVDSLSVLPDRSRTQVQTPMGNMTMVLTPASSFVLTPGGPQDMPPSPRDRSMKDLKTNALSVVSRADDAKVTVRAGGTEKVGDVEAQVLEVTADGASARWLVDPKTGRVVRTVSRTTGPAGPTEQV